MSKNKVLRRKVKRQKDSNLAYQNIKKTRFILTPIQTFFRQCACLIEGIICFYFQIYRDKRLEFKRAARLCRDERYWELRHGIKGRG